MCVADELEVTCTVDALSLTWKVNGEQRVFTRLSPVNSVMMIADFDLILLSNNQELVSTATLNSTNPTHNGTVLSCSGVANPNPLPEEMATITIIVQGKPSHTHTSNC